MEATLLWGAPTLAGAWRARAQVAELLVLVHDGDMRVNSKRSAEKRNTHK